MIEKLTFDRILGLMGLLLSIVTVVRWANRGFKL